MTESKQTADFLRLVALSFEIDWQTFTGWLGGCIYCVLFLVKEPFAELSLTESKQTADILRPVALTFVIG